jgi:hypothetical protein
VKSTNKGKWTYENRKRYIYKNSNYETMKKNEKGFHTGQYKQAADQQMMMKITQKFLE